MEKNSKKVGPQGAVGTIYRYLSEEKDVRYRLDLQENFLARLREHEVQTLIMVEKIFGCPHEEGTDYPEGEKCPRFPYWATHDRYTALE